MSAHRMRQADTPDEDGRCRDYPAPLPAGPWLIPAFWLAALVLMALFWASS